MRLHIEFSTSETAIIPLNHLPQVNEMVSALLKNVDVDKHIQKKSALGFGKHSLKKSETQEIAEESESLATAPSAKEEYNVNSTQRLMVTYSQLRIPQQRRRRIDNVLEIAPGRIDWYLASPYCSLLLEDIKNQMDRKPVLMMGDLELQVTDNDYVPYPAFSNEMIFTCLSPIVAMCRNEKLPTFLLPKDGVEFTNIIRRNLIRKYFQIHNRYPHETNLILEFDSDWLKRTSHRGTKKLFVGGKNVIGAFAPFKLLGSPELIRTAWECGLGDKNSLGFGMITASRMKSFDAKLIASEIVAPERTC